MNKEIELQISTEMELLCDALRMKPRTVLQLFIDSVSVAEVSQVNAMSPVVIATVLVTREAPEASRSKT
jgi:hypothetical protein